MIGVLKNNVARQGVGDDLLEVAQVNVAGDPDKSYLVMKLENTHAKNGGAGAQMPFGAAPLSPDKIAKIRQWIKDGAKP